MIIRITLLAIAFALVSLGGCAAIYRETRYSCRTLDRGEWEQIDSLDQYGQFTLECRREGITLQAPGQFNREYYPEKLGPPLIPVFSTKHATDETSRQAFARISISSPHDSCMIDIQQISLHVSNDSVVHPINFTVRNFVVYDTTRILLLEFRGPLFTSDTVRLDLGAFRVGSTEVDWPPLTYKRESDTHYVPLTFPSN